MAEQNLRDLFKQDTKHFNKSIFSDILFTFSKYPVNSDTIGLLLVVARQKKVEGRVSRMFSEEKINGSENRAATTLLSGN